MALRRTADTVPQCLAILEHNVLRRLSHSQASTANAIGVESTEQPAAKSGRRILAEGPH